MEISMDLNEAVARFKSGNMTANAFRWWVRRSHVPEYDKVAWDNLFPRFVENGLLTQDEVDEGLAAYA